MIPAEISALPRIEFYLTEKEADILRRRKGSSSWEDYSRRIVFNRVPIEPPPEEEDEPPEEPPEEQLDKEGDFDIRKIRHGPRHDKNDPGRGRAGAADDRQRETISGDAADHSADTYTDPDGIQFIGGNKNKKQEENEHMKEENDESWHCPECKTKLSGQPSKCPSCGIELEY